MGIGKGVSDGVLSEAEVREIVAQAAASLNVRGKRVLVIVPDGTRTMPMAEMFGYLQETIGKQAAACDYLVALGTHAPMNEAQLTRMFGREVKYGCCEGAHILNHQWSVPETFAELGTIAAEEVSQISGGLLREQVLVKINRTIFDYDQVLICGPVFPHEVVGFSGGNKYLFPGISGQDMINQTHWIGALIGSYNLIGTMDTPVRAMIDRAAAMIRVPAACLALVVTKEGIAGMFFGEARLAWREAAKLSSQRHIRWLDRPVRRVLAVMPKLYDDVWTAAKGMYKAEPAIADGGEVIIYAPHITELSYSHGALIDKVGYHCRDYFVKQASKFRDIPRGVLAHATHLFGEGIYDAAMGMEKGRIRVTLATAIPAERCARVNLGYMAPGEIHPAEWAGRDAEGILLIPRAGEILYRVKEKA